MPHVSSNKNKTTAALRERETLPPPADNRCTQHRDNLTLYHPQYQPNEYLPPATYWSCHYNKTPSTLTWRDKLAILQTSLHQCHHNRHNNSTTKTKPVRVWPQNCANTSKAILSRKRPDPSFNRGCTCRKQYSPTFRMTEASPSIRGKCTKT